MWKQDLPLLSYEELWFSLGGEGLFPLVRQMRSKGEAGLLLGCVPLTYLIAHLQSDVPSFVLLLINIVSNQSLLLQNTY